MARQLDILALEPYFGGVRRNMLETLVRCSRHRWTLLTLPPRRMERRLAASAHWFAEQLARRAAGPIDVLFTCDALNLADLNRLCPTIRDIPSVVYFHNNQLPDLTQAVNQQPMDLTNLTSSTAATEIWFNSKNHAATFLEGIKGLISLHRELQSPNPLDSLIAKMHLVPPPVDTGFFYETLDTSTLQRDPNSIFVETRDAHMGLLNSALEILSVRKRALQLLVSGPVKQLTSCMPRQVISESNTSAQLRALLSAGAFVSTKLTTPFDENAVRALSLGCRPVLPRTGVYPDLLPIALHSECLYDLTAESLASNIHDATYLPSMYRQEQLTTRLAPFDGLRACAVIDDRLDTLSANHLNASFTQAGHSLREARRRAIPNA